MRGLRGAQRHWTAPLLRLVEQVDQRRTELASKLVAEGRRAVAPLLQQVEDEDRENPAKEEFQEPLDLFLMALKLEKGKSLEATKALDAMWEAVHTARRHEDRNLRRKQQVEDTELVEAEVEVVELGADDKARRPAPNHGDPYDVIIVGAGASGVGMGLMLTRVFNLDPKRVLIVERGEQAGESFRRWPKEMRFISPSFNNQGWTASFDLNSVAFETSPAYSLGAEHPTGAEYAKYLDGLATQGELNIQYSTQVTAVRPVRTGGFKVDVAPARPDGAQDWAVDEAQATTLRSRYVVWAAGEFQYPRKEAPEFPGAELCRHNSSVRSWKELPGDDFVVIGGYESGMDAVHNLTQCGKRCTVASSTAFWKMTTDDPSTELAPSTMERVRQAFRNAQTPPRLLAPLRVLGVVKASESGGGGGGYVVRGRWGAPVKHPGGEHRTAFHNSDADIEEEGEEGTEVELRTPQPPLLCTGFGGSVRLGPARDLFEWGEKGSGCLAGSPLLNEHDESTKTPGLFLAGPAVRHDSLVFCFVYKFRQRFAVVADAIAQGLGHDTEQTVLDCRVNNMYLDNFSCCKGCSC
mgnify:FL=1